MQPDVKQDSSSRAQPSAQNTPTMTNISQGSPHQEHSPSAPYSPTSHPIVSSSQMKDSHSSKKSVLYVVILLFIALYIAGAVIGYGEIQKKNDEIKKLTTANGNLSQRIEELSSSSVKAKQQANDQKRKDDLGKFTDAVKKFKAEKRNYPSTEPSFFKKDFSEVYIKGKIANFIDPNTGKEYAFTPVAPVQTPPGLTLGNIQFQWPAECTGSEFADLSDESKAATRILLESGETYCINITT